MSMALSLRHRAVQDARSPLETLAIGILAAMVVVWIPFQVIEIGSLFPPIGILYTLGSIAIAAVMLLTRKRWSPALAAGWGVLMMIPESVPAIGHLRDWSDLYSHFSHYLVIVTFFPLAIGLVAAGTAATVQNYRDDPHARRAPSWTRPALLGGAAFILIANIVTIALYVFEIP